MKGSSTVHALVELLHNCYNSTGARPGTLLGVILFVVHIDDLEFECQYSKYVDDTNIMHISSDPASATLQNNADTAHTWPGQNDMIINATKTKEQRIDFSKSRGPFTRLYIGNSPIKVVSQSKILGVIISDDLKWNQHVEYITGKASQQLHLLVLCRQAGIPSNEMLLMYTTKIRPVLEYACAAWHPGLTQYLTDDIEWVQIRAMRIIVPGLSYGDALVCSQLPTLKARRN